MPFARPTLTQLRQQAGQDVASNVGVQGGFLRRAVLRVLAVVQAGLAYLHYGFLDWIALQAVPFTATGEFLEGWAALKGVIRGAATYASGPATFAGTNGTVLPAGTSIIDPNQNLWLTAADATVAGGSLTVTVTAQTAGSIGNLADGTSLTLSAAVAGIQAVGSASADFSGGTDVQTDDALRTEMLQVYSAPPQGGAVSDYVKWALAVAGVTRAWCVPRGQGVGTVVVYTMLDVTRAAENGFPQGTNGVATLETRDAAATGDQLTVANAIFAVEPVAALVYSCAPIADPIAFSIKGVAAGYQAAVSAAIADVFVRSGSPTGATVDIDDIWTAIAAVPGVSDFDIISPAADIVTAVGYLPTVGVITWS